MKNLSDTANRLRTVLDAQEQFLAMFALECIWDQPRPYERLANDLQAIDGPANSSHLFSARLLDN